MLGPEELPPVVRRVASDLVNRAWRWVTEAGAVCAEDADGRRFHAMGAGSRIAFPPGDLVGPDGIAIGAGTLIGADVTLAAGLPGQQLERGAEPMVVIGDRCSIGRGCFLVALHRIVIEDDVTLAPGVYVTDHNHTYADVDKPIGRQFPDRDPVRIGAGSWLGCGVKVLPGADIGRHVTVAAGSVVRGSVPDCSVIAGSPARVVRRYDPTDGWVPPLRRVVDPPSYWP